jgi:hypothetical protein
MTIASVIHGKATSSKKAIIKGESNMISPKGWPRIPGSLSGWAFFASPWRFPQIRK